MSVVFDTNEKFEAGLAELLISGSSKAIKDHDFFSIAFSGGSAATKICKALENKDTAKQIDFSKWLIFFCDERYVELTNADSNYKAIHDGLIQNHPEILKENIFTLSYGESVEAAADDYEKKFRSVFKDSEFPKIDLIVLGMGPDGHICSLFPNHKLLNENQCWVAAISDSPKPPPQRITITLNVVNNADAVIFIATGEGKAENVRKAIQEKPTQYIPASLVKPNDGTLTWFLDTGSASLLEK